MNFWRKLTDRITGPNDPFDCPEGDCEPGHPVDDAEFAMALIGLGASGTAILLVESELWFWVSGVTLGIFVGPLQAASRSHLARAAPEHLRNQMFGLFTFSGKATAFAGPLLVGTVTAATGSQRWGMSTVLVFFAIGFLLMLTVPDAGSGRLRR